MDISGQAAIVTGGASGLGLATAKRLAKAGAKVTLLDMNEEAGRKEAEAIGGHFIRVDVADDEAVRAAVAEAENRHGVARILINCAGIGMPSKMLNRENQATPLEGFSKIVVVNLIGTYNVIAKFSERLANAEPIGEERGVIINTASVAAYDGQIGQPAYSASKAGIVGMTLPIARELARFGIRVMTIAPGIFWTPMLAGLPEEAQASLGKQVPFPSRLGQPDEYAQLAEAIIANPMLNGETIRLDGAIRMAPK